MMSDLLYKVAIYLDFLPILIGLIRYKHLNKPLIWYLGLLIISKICSVISVKLGEEHINNHFMIYINAASSFILQTSFFYLLINSKNSKNILIVCLIAYLLGICVDIYLHGIYMNQYLFMISDFWAVIFLLVCLNQILHDETIDSLRSYPIFWIVTGSLFYYIFDFFLSVSNDWLYAINRSFFFLLWDYITPIFLFLKTIIVSIGYWKTKYYDENLVRM